MNTQRLTARDLFLAARAIRSESERLDYLRRACGDNLALLRKIEALLRADASAGLFLALPSSDPDVSGGDPPLETGATTGALQSAAEESAGEVIGRYKLLQCIGEGGFGLVWMAEQREPVKRRVALKVIKVGMDTRQVIARFEAERQALAMMDHPNIAKVLDAGSTETGRLYFVMEYIKGVPILEYCDTEKLDTKARLELFSSICHAIQHAHQKGIIHRDIKPSNVLVTLHDGVPAPKVIDFGIAKATSVELTTRTLFTEHRQMIGTPAYMSPEQAEMSGLDIDTRSDIYSLGVLLYELLTGTTPFDTKELTDKGFVEMMRIIREVEPHKPSTRLSSLGETGTRTAQQRHAVDAKKLGLLLRGDLDWIVMKCLEKDRTRRYETANSLALDIRRYLGGEPVLAAPPGAAYRLKKFVHRNRGPVIAGSIVVMTLVTGIVGTTIGFVQARIAQMDADRNAAQAREANAIAQREMAAAQRQAYSANMLAACDALERGEVDVARNYLDHATSDQRGWEWRHLSSRLDTDLRVHNHDGQLWQLHVAADGRSYYGISRDPAQTIRRWDVESGRLLETIPTDRPCWRSWLVAGGTQLVMHVSEKYFGAGAIEVWDLSRRARVSSWPILCSSNVSSDGALAGYITGRKLHLLDLRTGVERVVPVTPESNPRGWGNVGFQSDGRRMAVEWALGQIGLLDVDSLQVQNTLEAHGNAIWWLAFSPDGARLASASIDGTARITNIAADPPLPLAPLRGHHGWVFDVTFSPDGTLLASRGQDRTVRLWDVRTGRATAVFQTTGEQEQPTAFLPDGQTLLCADDNGTVHFWDVRSDEARILRGHRSYVYPAVLSPDGATICSGGWDGFEGQPGCLRMWDAASGDSIAAIGDANTYVLDAVFSPDGSRLAVSLVVDGESPRIDVLDTAIGATITSIPQQFVENIREGSCSLAFSPDGRRLAWIASRPSNYADPHEPVAVVSDTQTGATIMSRPMLKENAWPARLAWSPDGATIAICQGFAGVLHLVHADTLEPIREWPLGHYGTTCAVAFSPDSGRIVTAAGNGVARVWDAATGTLVHELIGRGNRLLCAAFSPDGQRIATGGSDNYITLWDARTFDPVARLIGHQDYVYSMCWRADSQLLISGSGDHTVRIWETQVLKDRIRARHERQAILAQVVPLVQRLFDELSDAARVAEVVKADATMNPRAREVALQVVLAAAIKSRSGTPVTSQPSASVSQVAADDELTSK